MNKTTIAISIATVLLVAGAGANYHIKSQLAEEYQAERDTLLAEVNQQDNIEVSVVSSNFNGNGVTERLSFVMTDSDGNKLDPLFFNHMVSFTLSGANISGAMKIDQTAGLAKMLHDKHQITLDNEGKWSYDYAKDSSQFEMFIDPSEFKKNSDSFDIDKILIKGSSMNGTQTASFEFSNLEAKSKRETFSIDHVILRSTSSVDEQGYSVLGDESTFTISGIKAIADGQGLTIKDISTTIGATDTAGHVTIGEKVFINEIKQQTAEGSTLDHGSVALDMELDNINKDALTQLLNAKASDAEVASQALDKITLDGPIFKINELSSKYINAKGMIQLKPIRASQVYYPSSILPFINAELYINANEAALKEIGAQSHAEMAVMQGLAVKSNGTYVSDIKYDKGETVINGIVVPM
ncbi:DUF945 family protein [Vibrio harveyi]|uniref:DUF945 family protein n=1 Tax=Vibrio harveyi TaxID=669 RepID=UPI003CF05A89